MPPEQLFERRLYRRNRPAVHWLFEAVRNRGPVVGIPRIGRLVNDGDVARAILLDQDHFNSHGPGSFGALITQALGPAALINMDGPAHQRHKRALLQIFSHRYVSEIVAAFGAPMVARLTARIEAGETVDFAAFMRDYGVAMAATLIGVPIDRASASAEHDDIFHLATEIMAFAGDGKWRLSTAQAARARTLGARLHGYVRRSFDGALGDDLSVTQRLRAEGYGFDEVKDLVTVVLVGATELVIYGLPRGLAAADVLKLLQGGRTLQRFVTVPEGLPSVYVRERLVAAAELTGTVAAPPEGSVLPDSYSFQRGDRRQAVLERMQRAMTLYLADAWARRKPNIAVKTPREALILASIVEKETGKPSERRMVAAVYSNRLKQGMMLQADPTIIYPITRGRPLGRRILLSEVRAVNAYNTYAMTGLPAGPICNPGRASIDAVLDPAPSSALYFVADGSGGHVFANTLAEHNLNVARWRAFRAAKGI